jgi:hypothetical protein
MTARVESSQGRCAGLSRVWWIARNLAVILSGTMGASATGVQSKNPAALHDSAGKDADGAVDTPPLCKTATGGSRLRNAL